MYLKHNEEGIRQILQKTFPKNKKDISVQEFSGPKCVNSYWDGGSKNEYVLYNLSTGETWAVPTSHPYFDAKPSGDRCGNLELRELPENCCLVQGGTFCGKPATITIYLRSENLQKLLPKHEEIGKKEKQALEIIRSIKGGYRQDEFNRAGLGKYVATNPHVVALEKLGLVKVNRAGSVQVTTAGKNIK